MTDNLVIRCVSAGESDTHYHKTWPELAACVGTYATLDVTVARYTPKVTAPASVPAAAPVATPAAPVSGMKHPTARPTVKQLEYISNLGGSWRDAALETREMASKLIDILAKKDEVAEAFQIPSPTVPLNDDMWLAFSQEKMWLTNNLDWYWKTPQLWDDAMYRKSKGQPGWADPPASRRDPEPTPIARPVIPDVRAEEKAKLEKMSPLFQTVPDGYYAVETGDGRSLKFVRISTYRKGHPREGSRKLQTIHGPNLEDAACIWKSGKVSVWNHDIVELSLLILSDHEGCLRRYAREIDKCCRCNTRLTDERSRRYGIGPECEKHWPWIIEAVHLEEAERGIA